MASSQCLPCSGGNRTASVKQVSGGATGGVSMRRESAVQRVWIVTCPDGEPVEVAGDKAAYDAVAKCGGSYTPKPLDT